MAGGRRTIRLTPAALEVFEELARRFEAKFGRPPGPEDPIFFDPDADEPRPMPAAIVEAAMTKAMHAVGVRPELIYAFKKTGMVVTEDNVDQWSDEDLASYEQAIDEFRHTR